LNLYYIRTAKICRLDTESTVGRHLLFPCAVDCCHSR